MKRLLHPEIVEGIRVRYLDRNEATREGRIHSRHGNNVTVIDSLKQKRRVKLAQIRGYWNPKKRASPENMIPLQAGETQCKKPSGTRQKKE